jgi:hypothetical protein
VKCPTCGHTIRVYVRKGRRTGENHPRHKLTQAQIEAIRASKKSSVALGVLYEVSPTHIWRIRSGKTWVTGSDSKP